MYCLQFLFLQFKRVYIRVANNNNNNKKTENLGVFVFGWWVVLLLMVVVMAFLFAFIFAFSFHISKPRLPPVNADITILFVLFIVGALTVYEDVPYILQV